MLGEMKLCLLKLLAYKFLEKSFANFTLKSTPPPSVDQVENIKICKCKLKNSLSSCGLKVDY